MNRYLIVQEPTCTWAVFDALADQPATLDGRVAIGLDKCEAEKMASRANTRLGASVISPFRVASPLDRRQSRDAPLHSCRSTSP